MSARSSLKSWPRTMSTSIRARCSSGWIHETSRPRSTMRLQTAQLDLGYTEIRSPIDGYVSNRAAQVGAYVKQGAYLVSVVPAAGLWVDANFKEDQLARIRPGQTATVRTDVLPHQPLHGRVLSLAHGTGAVFIVIPPVDATGYFTKIVTRVVVLFELVLLVAGV